MRRRKRELCSLEIRGAVLAASCLMFSALAFAQAEPPKIFEAWREGGAAPYFSMVRDMDAGTFELQDYQTKDEMAWAWLESVANETSAHFATDGFLSGKKLNGDESIPIQPARLNRGSGTFVLPLYFPVILPPGKLDAAATIPIADVDWVRNLTDRKLRPPEEENVFDDPLLLIVAAVAGQAVSRMSINGGNPNGTVESPVADFDPAGVSIFYSAGLALTAYATEGMPDPYNKLGAARMGFLHFSRHFDREYVGGQKGPNSVKLLGLGSSWQGRWAGLENEDLHSSGASRTSQTAIFNAVLANGGPKAIKAVFERPWPISAGSQTTPQAWIAWEDAGIKASGNIAGAWPGQTPFVAERGLAGAYVTSLSDILAMPARFQKEAPGEALPEGFATRYHLEALFNRSPCRVLTFSLEEGVTDIDLTLEEMTSSCVRVQWSGKGLGKDQAIPPIAISAFGEGLDFTDLDALLVASARGERVGLTVSDAESGKAVKTWMIDYVPDFEGDEAMTIAFANVAPEAADTRPLKLHLSIGSGLTAGRGEAIAQVNTAPPDQACRPAAVEMPPLAGNLPYAAIASVKLGIESGLAAAGDYGDLLGFATEGEDAGASGELANRLCSASQRWNTPKDSLSSLFANRGAEASSCFPDLNDVAEEIKRRKSEPALRRFSIDPSDAGNMSGLVVPVDAEVSWTDPSLPVYPAPGAMGPDDRRDDARVVMEGYLTYQVRDETRLRGRIDLAVPAHGDQSTCGAAPEGEITTVFDVVAALPDARSPRLIGPDPLSTISPDVWSTMPAAARTDFIRKGNRKRMGDTETQRTSSADGLAEPCLCTCENYADADQRKLCAPSCSDTLPKTCSAGPVTEAEKACYVKLISRNAPAGARAMIEAELRRTLDRGDSEAKRAMVREQIRLSKLQGQTCD